MKGITNIKIQGHFDKKLRYCFEYMEITYEGDDTIITGNIKDESHLHGILNKLRDLNLKLISINPEKENN